MIGYFDSVLILIFLEDCKERKVVKDVKYQKFEL